jgi:hypothetical protein
MNFPEAIAQLDDRINDCYQYGNPFMLNLTNHHPDFVVRPRQDDSGFEAATYVTGSPNLIGSFPLRNMIVVLNISERLVYPTAVFDGIGRYRNAMFGTRLPGVILNSFAQAFEIPHVFD